MVFEHIYIFDTITFVCVYSRRKLVEETQRRWKEKRNRKRKKTQRKCKRYERGGELHLLAPTSELRIFRQMSTASSNSSSNRGTLRSQYRSRMKYECFVVYVAMDIFRISFVLYGVYRRVDPSIIYLLTYYKVSHKSTNPFFFANKKSNENVKNSKKMGLMWDCLIFVWGLMNL